MVSEARTRVCSRLVMSRSSRSPALCPQVSLTTLNWSRSTYSSTYSPSPRCAAVTAAFEPRVELAPVDESGQRVVAGLVRQRALETPLLGDVAEHDDGADGHAPSRLRIGDAVSWMAQLLAAAIHQHVAIRGQRGLAGQQHAIERVGHGLARRLIDELQHIADGAAARLADGPAREPLGHGIQIVDAAVRRPW